jgi:enamine deaminase RidA (YjgF/YER057c/UK114 family)
MGPELVFVGQIAPGLAARGEDAAETQAQAAFAGLEAELAERGLRLDDLLRLRLFVSDLCDLPAIERAMDARALQWPAVSVVELPAGSTDPGVAVTLDAVAAAGAHEHRRVMRLEPGGRVAHAGLGGGPRSVRLGPWVFVSATAASTGRTPSSSPPDEEDVADSATQRIGEESRLVFARIAELLGEQGAELRDVVKVGGWLSFGMRDYGPLAEVRDALLDETGLMPASAGVQVTRVGADKELLAFEAIAFAPEDDDERERGGKAAPAPSRLARYYADARAAGGYVFTSGEVPDGRGSVRAQAREVYERLRSHLAAHGASPADVLHQTVFVRHASDADGLAEAAREFYGAEAQSPPTTLLNVTDLGFRPGCDVEIELIAASDGRSADAR